MLVLYSIGLLLAIAVKITAQLQSSEFYCSGSTAVYTCTVSSSVHTWKLATLSTTVVVTISRNDTHTTVSPFLFELVAYSSDVNTITSSLTVIAFAELNNTVILCEGESSNGTHESQQVTAGIYGRPIACFFNGITGLYHYRFSLVSRAYCHYCRL